MPLRFYFSTCLSKKHKHDTGVVYPYSKKKLVLVLKKMGQGTVTFEQLMILTKIKQQLLKLPRGLDSMHLVPGSCSS